MSNSLSDSARAKLEEEGFEALQRLYAEAVAGSNPEGSVCARLLLGLYNGRRFPFDLTDLRILPMALFEDAMRVLRMDGRLPRQEVHHYFDAGSRKFEDLVRTHEVQDIAKLLDTGDGAPQPLVRRGTLRHDDCVSTKLVTYGSAPGYRDVSLTLDCEVVGDERKTVGPVRLDPSDGERAMKHIQDTHTLAWRDPVRGPLDRAASEMPPRWLTRQGEGVEDSSLSDAQTLTALSDLLRRAPAQGNASPVLLDAMTDLRKRMESTP